MEERDGWNERGKEGEKKKGREERKRKGEEKKKGRKLERARKEMEEIPGFPVIVSWSILCLFPRLFLLFSLLLHTV